MSDVCPRCDVGVREVCPGYDVGGEGGCGCLVLGSMGNGHIGNVYEKTDACENITFLEFSWWLEKSHDIVSLFIIMAISYTR